MFGPTAEVDIYVIGDISYEAIQELFDAIEVRLDHSGFIHETKINPDGFDDGKRFDIDCFGDKTPRQTHLLLSQVVRTTVSIADTGVGHRACTLVTDTFLNWKARQKLGLLKIFVKKIIVCGEKFE